MNVFPASKNEITCLSSENGGGGDAYIYVTYYTEPKNHIFKGRGVGPLPCYQNMHISILFSLHYNICAVSFPVSGQKFLTW
jgi:hypothetical protein